MSEGYNDEIRRKAVSIVKACGADVIARAEDIVGDCDGVSDLSIWIRVFGDEVPTIEVSREHVCKQAMKVLCDNT